MTTLISTTVSNLCMASSQMDASIPIQAGQSYFDEGVIFAPAFTTCR